MFRPSKKISVLWHCSFNVLSRCEKRNMLSLLLSVENSQSEFPTLLPWGHFLIWTEPRGTVHNPSKANFLEQISLSKEKMCFHFRCRSAYISPHNGLQIQSKMCLHSGANKTNKMCLCRFSSGALCASFTEVNVPPFQLKCAPILHVESIALSCSVY